MFIAWETHRVDVKVLNVGKELKKETLPLQMGHRRYQLHGLKASMWYEVKISYPASVCIMFSPDILYSFSHFMETSFLMEFHGNLFKDTTKTRYQLAFHSNCNGTNLTLGRT